jgi:hypothetical protein
MKKIYSKPDVIFENFSLCTSIAASCEVKTDTQANNVCGYKFGALYVFTDKIQGCTTPIAEGSINDGLCYHNPSEDNNLFNS